MQIQNENEERKSNSVPVLFGMLLGIILVLLFIKFDPDIGTGGMLESSVQENSTIRQENKVYADDSDNSVTKAVKKSRDAVVSVINFQGGDFWSGTAPAKAGSGSGVIYKKEGSKAYVVTNHHVIDGATSLEISLNNEKKIPAKLLGSDPLTDLAVLEVSSQDIEDVIEFGDSNELQPGATAIAIGNPLGFLQGTVTKGVISSAERMMPVDIDQNGIVDWQAEVIQTDASINPGNSGGALIDINGQLIGINSAKIATDAVEGIGFAIPIGEAKPIMKDLEKFGEVRRPQIGISTMSLAEIPTKYWENTLRLPKAIDTGIVVMEVSPGSPAANAGMKKLDVITSINDKQIKDVVSLRAFLYKKSKTGDTITIQFYRNGKSQSVDVTLVEGNKKDQ